jgi:hypothetical protein
LPIFNRGSTINSVAGPLNPVSTIQKSRCDPRFSPGSKPGSKKALTVLAKKIKIVKTDAGG